MTTPLLANADAVRIPLADWGQGREAETELAGLPLFEMQGEE